MNSVIEQLSKRGREVVGIESAMLLGAGFKEAGRELVKTSGKNQRFVYGCARQFVLPDSKTPLVLGCDVFRNPANIVYGYFYTSNNFVHNKGLDVTDRAGLSASNDLLRHQEGEFHIKIAGCAMRLLKEFRLAPTWNPISMSNDERAEYLNYGYEKTAPYLTKIYLGLENMGFVFQSDALLPSGWAKPFVFKNADGLEVTVCRNARRSLVVSFSDETALAVSGLPIFAQHMEVLRRTREDLIEEREEAMATRHLNNIVKLHRPYSVPV